jgi:hypothetical protein
MVMAEYDHLAPLGHEPGLQPIPELRRAFTVQERVTNASDS